MVLGIVVPVTAAGAGDCKTVDDLWTKAFADWMSISFEVENAAQQLATIRHVDIPTLLQPKGSMLVRSLQRPRMSLTVQ